jgi:hypothetical protein
MLPGCCPPLAVVAMHDCWRPYWHSDITHGLCGPEHRPYCSTALRRKLHGNYQFLPRAPGVTAQLS